MKRLIRDWSFPAVVLVVWMVATVFTVRQLSHLPFGRTQPAATSSRNPAS